MLTKCIDCEYGIIKDIEDADDPHYTRRHGYKLCFRCNMLNTVFMFSKYGAGFSKLSPNKNCPFQ